MNAVMIADLEVSKELDRAALAKVVGGYSVYAQSGWYNAHLGSRVYSSWRRNIFTGRYYRTWYQNRYAQRVQYGKELAATGTQYA